MPYLLFNGALEGPPRSPDMTPTEFFYRVMLRYKHVPKLAEDMETRISNFFPYFSPNLRKAKRTPTKKT